MVALQRAEMRMVRWMCGVKLKDRLPSKELRERQQECCNLAVDGHINFKRGRNYHRCG